MRSPRKKTMYEPTILPATAKRVIHPTGSHLYVTSGNSAGVGKMTAAPTSYKKTRKSPASSCMHLP